MITLGEIKRVARELNLNTNMVVFIIWLFANTSIFGGVTYPLSYIMDFFNSNE